MPYEGFETSNWDSCLFSNFDSLQAAVHRYFEPWAEKWTKLQTLVDYYRQLEGLAETATDFTEISAMAELITESNEHKAPTNSYYLAILYALQGHLDEAVEWACRYEAQGGGYEAQQRVIDDIKRGQFRKQVLANVVLSQRHPRRTPSGKL